MLALRACTILCSAEREKTGVVGKLYKKPKTLKQKEAFPTPKATTSNSRRCPFSLDLPAMATKPQSQTKPKATSKHRYPQLQDMTFSWRPGKFQRANELVKETSTRTAISNKANDLVAESISIDTLCNDCLPYLGSLEMLDFGIFSNDQHLRDLPTGQWLRKIAQNEGALHASHALGYQMASQVSSDTQLQLKAQACYISALSVTSKLIPQSNNMASLIRAVAILCAYCAVSGDAEGCRTHYHALARMVNDLKGFEMLDQTDRNILLITSSAASKFLLEPSISQPASYGCYAWAKDETVVEFREHFRVHTLPVAESLKQGQGVKLAAAIQDCRELICIGQQLMSLPLSQFGACQRVQVWVETRYQILSSVLINIYHEFEKHRESLWACVTLGVVCALHLSYHTRHDPRPLCAIPFSHLKRNMEKLAPILQAGKHSGTVTWICFVGACGEQSIEPLFNKDHKWFTELFKQAITWPERQSISQLEETFKQLLYDQDVQGPSLEILFK